MEMKLVRYRHRQAFVAVILIVADDRMADMRHVGAELVLPAGRRLERHPRHNRRRLVDDAVVM